MHETGESSKAIIQWLCSSQDMEGANCIDIQVWDFKGVGMRANIGLRIGLLVSILNV
jgi:hypothetical protein